eukprot:750904-Hanusia_phi.AAC.7
MHSPLHFVTVLELLEPQLFEHRDLERSRERDEGAQGSRLALKTEELITARTHTVPGRGALRSTALCPHKDKAGDAQGSRPCSNKLTRSSVTRRPNSWRSEPSSHEQERQIQIGG